MAAVASMESGGGSAPVKGAKGGGGGSGGGGDSGEWIPLGGEGEGDGGDDPPRSQSPERYAATPPFSPASPISPKSASSALQSSVRSDHPDDYDDHPSGHTSVSSDGGADSACESYYGGAHGGADSAASSINSPNLDDQSHSSEGSGDDSLDEDDDSLGFPPGHITRLDEVKALQNHGERPTDKKSVNPSIIPSYFFCPINETIMKDPVITPDGNTFERRAILRSLILEEVDPISRKPLSHEEIREDYLVKQAIEKARKEAWIRYVVEFKDEEVEKIVEQEKEWQERSAGQILDHGTDDSESDEGEPEVDVTEETPMAVSPEPEKPELPQFPPPFDVLPSDQSVDQPKVPRKLSQDDSIRSPSSTDSAGAFNHGWSVPLGVHKIVCSSPGMVVTSDVHRRSNVVKRKIIKQTLIVHDEGKKKSPNKLKVKSRRKRHKGLKTTTTVVTQDLVLPPGSHVDILETRVHGGRVRGRIEWEEEVVTEIDRELQLLLEEEEVRKRAMERPRKSSGESPKKQLSKKLFRKKASTGKEDKRNPFTSDLFDRPPPHHSPVDKRSRSSSPLTTIKYEGWISLQWAGNANSHEREEAMKRRRTHLKAVAVAADEDEGPWTEPLPLGVYRISEDATVKLGSSAKQLPLYESAESESNIADFLVCSQCIEVVETRVLVMRKRGRDKSGAAFATAEGKHVVRARCMVPVILSSISADNFAGNDYTPTPLQRKFRSGWITLSGGMSAVTASPIPTGAYIVTTNDPLVSCDSSAKIKSIFPTGSCLEVDATMIEFEEKEKKMKCHSCGRQNTYHTVAVRSLISSGGYVTLSSVSIGASGTHDSLCVCGKLVQQTNAEPVPFGTYRITRPALLTHGSGQNTPAITQLKENAWVQVLNTRVEDGCVRGRVNVVIASDLNGDATRKQELVTGWVSLFEPPSTRWAELTTKAVL
ncbi:hypothetical protein ACHAXT_009400 [Thalassiosira profunda]